jgi:hypothetical protein
MSKRYGNFDKYGLDHLLTHLTVLGNDDSLLRILFDKDWQTRRRLDNFSTSSLLKDFNLGLDFLTSRESSDFLQLIGLTIEKEIIRIRAERILESKDLADIIAIANSPNLLENIAYDLFQEENSDLSTLFNICLKFYESNEKEQAETYSNKFLAKVLRAKKGGGYTDEIGYLVFEFDRKISKQYKAKHLRDILKLIYSTLDPVWLNVVEFWNLIDNGDFSAASRILNNTISGDLQRLYHRHPVSMVFVLRVIIRGMLKLFGKSQTLSYLDNLYQLGSQTAGQRRGAFYFQLSRVYSEIGIFSMTLKAIGEIPTEYSHVVAEALENLAGATYSLGKFNMAKQLLFESFIRRQHQEYSTDVTPAVIKLLYKFGFIDLALQGFDFLSEAGIFGTMYDKLQEVLSNYGSSQPKGWLEIIELERRRLGYKKDFPLDDNIKEYFRLFLDSYHEFTLESLTDLIGKDRAEEDYKKFLSYKYERYLSIQSDLDITNNISLVDQYSRGAVHLLGRALVCDAIIKKKVSQDQMLKWMKLALSSSRSSFHRIADDLLIYMPIMDELGIKYRIYNQVQIILEKYAKQKAISENFITIVSTALIADLKKDLRIKVVRGKSSELEILSVQNELDYHRRFTNLDLDDKNLPLVLLSENETFRIYDVRQDQVDEILLALENHGWEGIIEK